MVQGVQEDVEAIGIVECIAKEDDLTKIAGARSYR